MYSMVRHLATAVRFWITCSWLEDYLRDTSSWTGSLESGAIEVDYCSLHLVFCRPLLAVLYTRLGSNHWIVDSHPYSAANDNSWELG